MGCDFEKDKETFSYTYSYFSYVSWKFVAFFSVTPSFHGVILEVHHNDQEKKQLSLWVLDIPPKEIKNKTESEIRKMYKYEGVIFSMPSYLPDKVTKDLTAGQQVKIYYNGQVAASAPGLGDAYWVSIVDK